MVVVVVVGCWRSVGRSFFVAKNNVPGGVFYRVRVLLGVGFSLVSMGWAIGL